MAVTPSPSSGCCTPVAVHNHHRTSYGVIAAVVVAILAAMIVALVAIVQAGSATIVPQQAPASVVNQPPTVIVIPNAQPYLKGTPYETDPDWEFELPVTP